MNNKLFTFGFRALLNCTVLGFEIHFLFNLFIFNQPICKFKENGEKGTKMGPKDFLPFYYMRVID